MKKNVMNIQEEEARKTLELPLTKIAKRKLVTAFNCFNICKGNAEENVVLAKDIIIFWNMHFLRGLEVAKKQTSFKDYFKNN